MDKIDQYIAKLWEPDKYVAHDYVDMELPAIEDMVRAKRSGKRGRPPYTAETIAFHIWIDSVLIDPVEGLNFGADLEAIEDDLQDTATFVITELEDLDMSIDKPGKRGQVKDHTSPQNTAQS